MFLILLISATLEIVLNKLLYQNQALLITAQRLRGKVLGIELAELEMPIILVFSDCQVDVINTWDDKLDCKVRTCLTTLLESRSMLQFIKHSNMEIEGDLQLVYHLVMVLDMIEFDSAELLAPWFGDVIAEGIIRIITHHLAANLRRMRIIEKQLSLAVTDEWQLVPSVLELAWFYGEIDKVTQAQEHLVYRIKQLEAIQ